jgi:hypothetical protein
MHLCFIFAEQENAHVQYFAQYQHPAPWLWPQHTGIKCQRWKFKWKC